MIGVLSYGMIAKSSVTFFGQHERQRGVEAIADVQTNARPSGKFLGNSA